MMTLKKLPSVEALAKTLLLSPDLVLGGDSIHDDLGDDHFPGVLGNDPLLDVVHYKTPD